MTASTEDKLIWLNEVYTEISDLRQKTHLLARKHQPLQKEFTIVTDGPDHTVPTADSEFYGLEDVYLWYLSLVYSALHNNNSMKAKLLGPGGNVLLETQV